MGWIYCVNLTSLLNINDIITDNYPKIMMALPRIEPLTFGIRGERSKHWTICSLFMENGKLRLFMTLKCELVGTWKFWNFYQTPMVIA